MSSGILLTQGGTSILVLVTIKPFVHCSGTLQPVAVSSTSDNEHHSTLSMFTARAYRQVAKSQVNPLQQGALLKELIEWCGCSYNLAVMSIWLDAWSLYNRMQTRTCKTIG